MSSEEHALGGGGVGGGSKLVTRLPAVLYNNRRIPPSWSLDSSDIELVFAVSEKFVEQFTATVLALREAQPHASDENIVDQALRLLAVCQILFFDYTLPRVFVRHVDGTSSMLPVAAPRTRLAFDPKRRCLRMFLKRTLPISSNHSGRPFRLAFSIGDDVIHTPAIMVHAKQGPPDRPRKNLQPPAVEALDDNRAAALARIHAVLPPRNVWTPTAVPFPPADVQEAPPTTTRARRGGSKPGRRNTKRATVTPTPTPTPTATVMPAQLACPPPAAATGGKRQCVTPADGAQCPSSPALTVSMPHSTPPSPLYALSGGNGATALSALIPSEVGELWGGLDGLDTAAAAAAAGVPAASAAPDVVGMSPTNVATLEELLMASGALPPPSVGV